MLKWGQVNILQLLCKQACDLDRWFKDTWLISTKFTPDIFCMCNNTFPLDDYVFFFHYFFVLEAVKEEIVPVDLNEIPLCQNETWPFFCVSIIYLFKSTSFILGDLWVLIMYLKNKMSFMKSANNEFFLVSGRLCPFLPSETRSGVRRLQLLSPCKLAASAHNSKAGEMSCLAKVKGQSPSDSLILPGCRW